MRFIAPCAWLYTEMEPLQAILHEKKRSFYFDDAEHPIALQVGGADQHGLVRSVKIAEVAGFDEINLNLGCPSPKVQRGHFGACLMKEGAYVAECVARMKEVATIPVSVKMRVGVDEFDSLDFFLTLANQLIVAGVDKLIVHARKALLKGLNPKQNRTVPNLQYDYVYALKQQFQAVEVILNGQLDCIEVIQAQQTKVNGVMVGRLACRHPYALSAIHQALYPSTMVLTAREVVHAYLDYACQQVRMGEPFSRVCRPLFAMAYGQAHAKQWKHALMAVIEVRELKKLFSLKDVYEYDKMHVV